MSPQQLAETVLSYTKKRSQECKRREELKKWNREFLERHLLRLDTEGNFSLRMMRKMKKISLVERILFYEYGASLEHLIEILEREEVDVGKLEAYL